MRGFNTDIFLPLNDDISPPSNTNQYYKEVGKEDRSIERQCILLFPKAQCSVRPVDSDIRLKRNCLIKRNKFK